MNFNGAIVAADATENTITIKCDMSIRGIIVGDRVILITNEWLDQSNNPTNLNLFGNNKYKRFDPPRGVDPGDR